MLKIHTIPDPILRKKAAAVTDPSVYKELSRKMIDLMKKSHGVGLAAPQVGSSIQLFVMGYKEKKEDEAVVPFKVWVNPEIVKFGDKTDLGVEGCLSVPDLELLVERATEVTVRGKNKDNQLETVTYEGYPARVAQHEIDHLNGILFTDRKRVVNVIVMGSPSLSIAPFEALRQHPGFNIVLVVTETDKPAGRGLKLKKTPVKEWAEKNNLKVVSPERLDPNELATLAGSRPDVILVTAYNKILKKEILELPQFGSFNVHFSLLPKYRGASPVQAAILAGDKKSGVTIIKMDERIDTGQIIGQADEEIRADDTSETLASRLAEISAEILPTLLLYTIAKTIEPKPQRGKSSYAKRITKTDGEINWQQKPEQIERFIRAMTPWPGAFTYVLGERLKVLKAHLENGSLIIDLVQRPGKNPITVAEFKRNLPKSAVLPF